MAKDCPQCHNKKPPMQVNSVAMSTTEIKLAALSEGKEMGLFVLGDESHLMEFFFFPSFFSDQVYCARGTVPKLHIKATSKEEGERTSP